MPVYQYRCPTCSNEFDQVEKMGLDTHPNCTDENCSGVANRMLGRVGFAFKGGPPTPNFTDARNRRKRFLG